MGKTLAGSKETVLIHHPYTSNVLNNPEYTHIHNENNLFDHRQ